MMRSTRRHCGTLDTLMGKPTSNLGSNGWEIYDLEWKSDDGGSWIHIEWDTWNDPQCQRSCASMTELVERLLLLIEWSSDRQRLGSGLLPGCAPWSACRRTG